MDWSVITHLGRLRWSLKELNLARNSSDITKSIVKLVCGWKDVFVIVTSQDTVPKVLQLIKRIRISTKEPIKATLLRHFNDLSTTSSPVEGAPSSVGAPDEEENLNQSTDLDHDETTEESVAMEGAPVEEEIDVKLPPRIHQRICEVCQFKSKQAFLL